MSYGQMRQNCNVLPRHINSMFIDAKIKHTKKINKKRTHASRQFDTWRILCSVLGLLCDIWHRMSWICAGYSEISGMSKHLWCCPVSESLFSEQWQAQNTQEWQKVKHFTFLFYKPRSKFFWTSAEKAEACGPCPSNLRQLKQKSEPKYRPRGAEVSFKVTKIICSDCLKKLSQNYQWFYPDRFHSCYF